MEPLPWFLEHDSGSGQLELGCCLLRAGLSERAGLAEVPVVPACSCSVWRWQGGEKFHRSAGSQENLRASCWRQQQPSLSARSWLSESSDRKHQSQQQTHRHLIESFTDTDWKTRVYSIKKGWFDASIRIQTIPYCCVLWSSSSGQNTFIHTENSNYRS